MFDKHTLRYLLGIFLLTLLFLVIGISIIKFTGSIIFINHFLSVVFFFLIVNTVFHFFLIYFFKKNPNKFFLIFMLFTISKILVYATFLIIYLLSVKTGIKCYLISFLFAYLGYTIYEVVMLGKFFKK
jgi:hypothetical protein